MPEKRYDKRHIEHMIADMPENELELPDPAYQRE